MPERTAWVEFVILLLYSHTLILFFVTCVSSDILWSNCFENIRIKQKFSFLCFMFTLLNKYQKLTVHERENLVFERNYGPGKTESSTRVNHSNIFVWSSVVTRKPNEAGSLF